MSPMDNEYFLDKNDKDHLDSYLEWLISGDNFDDDLSKSLFFLLRRQKKNDLFGLFKLAYANIEHLVIEEEDSEADHTLISDDISVDHSLREIIDLHESLSSDDIDLSPAPISSSKDELNNTIIGLINGDQKVYNNLYEDLFPIINSYIKQNSGTLEDTKDIFQQSIVILIEKIRLPNFELTSSVGTYLYSICRNLWLKEIRDKKIKFVEVEISEYGYEEIYFPEEEENRYQQLEKAMSMLGDACQKLIKCFYYELRKWDEIASVLNYSSAESARNQKYKCVQKIKQLIGDE